MGRRERPLEPGPLQEFAQDLRELRARTGLTYRALSHKARYSPSALSAAASGDSLPTLDVLRAYVQACGGDSAWWEQRWYVLAENLRRTQPGLLANTGEPARADPHPAPYLDPEPEYAYGPGYGDVDVPASSGSGSNLLNGRRAIRWAQFGLAPLFLSSALVITHAIMASNTSARTMPPAADPSATSTAATSTATLTPRLLGAPDFNGYCRATGQGSVQLAGTNAYAWRCSAYNGTGDDATAVCAWTYRLPVGQVTPNLADFNNPHTWQCWRITRQLRPPRFDAYCQATGHDTVELTGHDAYGWHCADGSGIDADAACEWTNNTRVMVSRFQDFYNPDSWQCWK